MTTPAATQPLSVAIVDDEPMVRVSLRRLCEVFGLRATVYASGREFIDSLDGGGARPDCVLLDAQMPGLTGLEVQRELASRGIRLPTIVLTGDEASEALALYAATSVAAVLPKPVDSEVLRTTILTAARAAGSRRD